jgi:hypothetical protein
MNEMCWKKGSKRRQGKVRDHHWVVVVDDAAVVVTGVMISYRGTLCLATIAVLANVA